MRSRKARLLRRGYAWACAFRRGITSSNGSHVVAAACWNGVNTTFPHSLVQESTPVIRQGTACFKKKGGRMGFRKVDGEELVEEDVENREQGKPGG